MHTRAVFDSAWGHAWVRATSAENALVWACSAYNWAHGAKLSKAAVGYKAA